MTKNDVALLERLLSEDKASRAPDWPGDEHFLYFAAEHWMKDTGLSGDQLLDGNVDGTHDLGIDGFWATIDGRYLTPDFNLALVSDRPRLHLTILQAKATGGFSEDPISKLCVNLPLLLNVDRDDSALASIANAKILDRSRRCLLAYEELGTRFPQLTVDIVYVTKSAEKESGGVKQKATALKRAIKSTLGNDTIADVRFVNAAEIRHIAASRIAVTRELRVAEGSMGTEFGNAVVCLVRFDDYFKFITNHDEELIPELFEANVRDYGGDVSVNTAIRATLSSQRNEDFWWYNNGVTIVARELTPQPKKLVVRDPQIVNGLQT
jgi:hypothetical protein